MTAYQTMQVDYRFYLRMFRVLLHRHDEKWVIRFWRLNGNPNLHVMHSEYKEMCNNATTTTISARGCTETNDPISNGSVQ